MTERRVKIAGERETESAVDDRGSRADPALHPFLVTPSATFGRPVCRLGLASYISASITTDDVLYAVSRGVSFLSWLGVAEGPPGNDAFSAAVASLSQDRPSVVV